MAAGVLALAALPSPAHAFSGLAPPCYRASAGRIPAHPILAFGDSITEGVGASANCLFLLPNGRPASPRDRTYPGYLSRLLGMPILNDGLGGEQATIGRTRLAAALKTFHPGTVLLMEGTNDLVHGRSPAATVTVIAADLAAIRHAHAVPILLTPPPLGTPGAVLYRQEADYANRLVALALHVHVTVIDVRAAFSRRPALSLMTQYHGIVDYTHPGDAGYRLIAELVAQALAPAPPLPAGKRAPAGGRAPDPERETTSISGHTLPAIPADAYRLVARAAAQ